jgi:hypothetical protein
VAKVLDGGANEGKLHCPMYFDKNIGSTCSQMTVN